MTFSNHKHHIFWFRRDLRLDDNHGLFKALESGLPVKPIFIFDREILDKLDNPEDRRVLFIHKTLSEMKIKLNDNSIILPEDKSVAKYTCFTGVFNDGLSISYSTQSPLPKSIFFFTFFQFIYFF